MKKPFCQLSVLVVTKTNVMTNKPNITISDPITRLCNEIRWVKAVFKIKNTRLGTADATLIYDVKLVCNGVLFVTAYEDTLLLTFRNLYSQY
jgi:hypothetical protein